MIDGVEGWIEDILDKIVRVSSQALVPGECG
jgi:hypothetical protein